MDASIHIPQATAELARQRAHSTLALDMMQPHAHEAV